MLIKAIHMHTSNCDSIRVLTKKETHSTIGRQLKNEFRIQIKKKNWRTNKNRIFCAFICRKIKPKQKRGEQKKISIMKKL